jgi:hypothetical protein
MGAELPTLSLPDRNWKEIDQRIPQKGMLVKYRTAYYQMLGYLNETGRWMAVDGLEESLPVKAWREIVDPPSSWPEIA